MLEVFWQALRAGALGLVSLPKFNEASPRKLQTPESTPSQKTIRGFSVVLGSSNCCQGLCPVRAHVLSSNHDLPRALPIRTMYHVSQGALRLSHLRLLSLPSSCVGCLCCLLRFRVAADVLPLNHDLPWLRDAPRALHYRQAQPCTVQLEP